MCSLRHHGIKGQQWGVRRGPPYPIEDRVLREGTKLSTVDNEENSERIRRHKNDWLYTYNTNDEHDRNIYLGPFASFLTNNEGRGYKFINEHFFETVRDLKMPTSDERIEEFIKVYKNNPRKVGSELEIENYKLPGKGLDSIDLDFKNLKTDKDFEEAYKVFGHAMEYVNDNWYKSVRDFKKQIGSKYDAMVDDNNVVVYNQAHDPIIVFDARNTLKTILPSRSVSDEEVKERMKILEEELVKSGHKMVY